MRYFGVLDRSVVREVLTPTILGFSVYTFLLLMRGIFTLMEQIFVRGVQWVDALRILGATIPNVIVLTIPMSFLFGVLLGVGRMNADNEMVALQAGGISARRILWPILMLGLVLAAVNLYLFVEVIPESNRRLRELKVELYASATNIGRIEPKVFIEDLPNILLYIRDVDPETGVWRRVMVYDTSDPSEERLTLAARGRMVSTIDDVEAAAATTGMTPSSVPWLLLEDVVTHQFFRSKPEKYRVNNTPRQLIRPAPNDRGSVRVNLGVRERSTDELLLAAKVGSFADEEADAVDDEKKLALRREAGLELHRRIAIPMACVVFALLAVPLGIGSRAGGRGRGFVVSLAVVVLYYVMSNHGELLAQEGRVSPWLGTWAANIILTIAALVMMRRMGYWIGDRGGRENLVALIGQRWRRWRQRRGTGLADRQSTATVPVGVQRRHYTAGFPTMLDRYVTRRLLAPVVMVLLSTVLLYIVIDLTDHIDDMARHQAPAEVIVSYYWNLLPQAVMDVLPMALMIGLLILLTVLERQRELTAIKAAGISLYRLVLPAMLIGVVGVAAMWGLSESVVPKANAQSKRMLDRIRGRETARSYRVSDRQWLVSRDEGTFYNFMQYDPGEQSLLRFSMIRVDDESRLTYHLVAPRLRYRDGTWIADGGWFRTFGSSGAERFERVTSSLEVAIPEGPDYFGQEYRRPGEMTFRELGAYIRALEESGYEPGQLRVRWHQKFSYPVSALVMVMLALPFGLNRGGGRATTMQGVAVALGLGIGYFLLVALFGKMGEAGLLPAALGAWAPGALAVLFSANRFTTLRT